MNINDFKKNDYYFFSRIFSSYEFEKFSTLSKDTNKLHYDNKFAQACNFTKAILPLHLSLAPLSHVCGNVFPGLPSLIHSIKATAYLPIHYDTNINYSSIIKSVSAATSTLCISSLIYDDNYNVLANAYHTVGVTSNEWEATADTPDYCKASITPLYLIFGSSSDIATRFIESLCKYNINILAVSREPITDSNLYKLNQLKKRNNSTGAVYSLPYLSNSFENISEFITSHGCYLSQAYFFPSLSIRSSLNDHLHVSQDMLLAAIKSILNIFLRQQTGKFYFISSTSVGKLIKGFENYSLAKSISEKIIESYHDKFSRFGVNFSNIRLPLVSTKFSVDMSEKTWKSMSPFEVSDCLSKISQMTSVEKLYILEPSESDARVLIATTQISECSHEKQVKNSSSLASSVVNKHSGSEFAYLCSELNSYLMDALDVPEDSLKNLRIGQTPNWDSLAHVQIIATVENLINRRLSPSNVESVRCYDDLIQILEKYLADDYDS